MYEPIFVNVNSSSYFVLWIIVLIFALFIVLVFATYSLYKVIKNRNKDWDDEKGILVTIKKRKKEKVNKSKKP